jgi:putative inorganic carbon (hco3(-)) transporter
MIDKEKLSRNLDLAIIVLFTIQLSSLNFSIALSSISFVLWLLIWLYKVIFLSRIKMGPGLKRDIKYTLFFIGLFILFDFISRMIGGFQASSVEGLRRHLLFAVFLFTVFSINSREKLIKVIIIIFIAASLVSVYELIIYSSTLKDLMKKTEWGYIRIDYFAHPLTQGQIKMLVLLFTLPIILSKEKLPVNKKMLIILLIPLFISMFLTQSRNVYLGFGAALFIYGFLENKKLLAAFIIICIVFWFAAPENFKSRIESIIDVNQPSNKARIEMWKVSKDIFLDYPFFGLGERVHHFEEIYSQYKVIEKENWGEGTHLHNNLLMILVQFGIFGLISFIGIFLSIFFRQIKYLNKEDDRLNKLILLGSLLVMISFHVAGIFDYNFRDQKVAPFLFFFIAVPFTIYRLKNQNDYE